MWAPPGGGPLYGGISVFHFLNLVWYNLIMPIEKTKTKICKTCTIEKPREDFPLYKSGPKAGQLASASCKACKNKKQAADNGSIDYTPRGYYRQSDEMRKNAKSRYRKRKRIRIREYVRSVLSGASCTDCQETDIVVLQFDHRDPAVKSFDISVAMNGSISLDRIKAEIAKCDVVCANCHIRRTARMFGSWRLGG